ncbi:MAG: ABC transporter permease [Caldilineaceae bacterium]
MAYLGKARRAGTAGRVTEKEDRTQNRRCVSPECWLLGLLLVFITGWEIGVATQWVNALFFPAPSTIVRTLGEMMLDGSLLLHVNATLVRLMVALLLGGGVGLSLGLLMGWSPRLGAFLDPLVAALHPLPKITLLPLVMVVLGIGESSKLVTIALSCFFPMLLNTLAGVQQIAPIYWEVAQNYGAKRWQLFTRILLPGALPLLLTGLRLALNTALIVTLSVELLMAQTGVGSLIWLAWQTMRLRHLYAMLIVIALLGYGFNLLIGQLSARLAPWQAQQVR